jgi:hypothetical protein
MCKFVMYNTTGQYINLMVACADKTASVSQLVSTQGR